VVYNSPLQESDSPTLTSVTQKNNSPVGQKILPAGFGEKERQEGWGRGTIRRVPRCQKLASNDVEGRGINPLKIDKDEVFEKSLGEYMREGRRQKTALDAIGKK